MLLRFQMKEKKNLEKWQDYTAGKRIGCKKIPTINIRWLVFFYAFLKRRGEKLKKILDACCGSRMFWFDRTNQDVLFADNRELETTLCDGRELLVKPDVKMDFRDMPYEDNTFKVVVFDPPHLKSAGTGSWLAKKYGILPNDWKTYLKAGFDECMRVLEPDGILVFKWNEDQIKLNDVLKEFGKKPLLGDQRGKTRWILFMK